MSLVWVTNLSAPYRRPVWSALSARVSLQVGLLARTEPNRRWSTDLPNNTARLTLRSRQIQIGSSSHYVLGTTALRGVSARSVILPGWEHPAAWQLLIECKLKKIPTIAFYESTTMSRRFSKGFVARARRWFFRHVDVVLTVGRSSEDAVLGLGVPASRVVVTRNSVDLDAFVAPDIPAIPTAERARRFAYVGQLIERKNVEALLHALARCPEDFTLDIIGEGPLRDNLVGLATELHLADRVVFVGYQEPEEVRRRLLETSTLVLPSSAEVHGLAPVEALALGLHAVVTDRAGIAADLRGMPGVWIVAPLADDLAGAMISSSLSWSGPIESPPVREWTPERFAADVLHAVDVAESRKLSR